MSQQQNTPLVDLLEREFERLRIREGQDKYRSINEMAQFLGIQPSTLSHYRTSKRLLGRNAARDFADRLLGDQQGGNAALREALAIELYAARPAKPGEAEVQNWLKSIGAPKNLLLVEFRQLPAARPSGPNPTLAADVGQAIASGLVYGLLLPFPTNFSQLPKISEEQKAFVGLIKKDVIDTYKSILWESLDEAYRLGKTQTTDLVAVASRLRVYTLKEDNGWADPCPGIGYKLFLHRHDKCSQIWQWISQINSHRLIKHEPGEVETKAIESRLYPLLTYFDENDQLPNMSEIKQFVGDDFQRPEYSAEWQPLDPIKPTDLTKLIAKVQQG